MILIPNITWAGDGKGLYIKNCSSCHHPERYGISAPPLIPETLGKKGADALKLAIMEGLPSTNMPSFKGILSEAEIEELVRYIKMPVESPRWGTEDIIRSISINNSEPQSYVSDHNLDYSNLFMVVEAGTGSIHFMDGDTFRLLDKVKVGAVHGGPKYDYDFKNAYIVSRDGGLVKYDLRTLREIGRIRVGINTRNIAVSGDGRYIAVANALPRNLIILDAVSLRPIKLLEEGVSPGAVYTLKNKGLFVAVPREKGELWLIDYKNDFNLEKVKTDQPFSDFFIEPGEKYLIGTSRSGDNLSIFDLDERRTIKIIEVDGMPHLASAAIWREGDRAFAAFPHIGRPMLTVIELYNWTVKKRIGLKGPGFFARTHDKSPYIWVDTGTDTIQLIDKTSLSVSKEIIPDSKKWAMHVEFTRDGRYALISVRENDGAVVIYDALSLRELKRLPFAMPVGKYNATNKTS